MTVNVDLLRRKPKLITKGERLCTRRRSGRYEKGVWVSNDPVTAIFTANVQPITGKELLQVPEGERNREHLAFFTGYKLAVKDEVERDGKVFEIHKVENWGAYVKATGVLKDV
jgi:hypothetical protein